jgi:hypothetical protein
VRLLMIGFPSIGPSCPIQSPSHASPPCSPSRAAAHLGSHRRRPPSKVSLHHPAPTSLHAGCSQRGTEAARERWLRAGGRPEVEARRAG